MNDQRERGKLALALSVATIISSNVVGGVLVGYLLDRWFETGPWMIVTGLILGSVSGFIGLIRILNRLNK